MQKNHCKMEGPEAGCLQEISKLTRNGSLPGQDLTLRRKCWEWNQNCNTDTLTRVTQFYTDMKWQLQRPLKWARPSNPREVTDLCIKKEMYIKLWEAFLIQLQCWSCRTHSWTSPWKLTVKYGSLEGQRSSIVSLALSLLKKNFESCW